MGGSNPYIVPTEIQLPKKPYTLNFSSAGKVVEVDPTDLPSGGAGLPGSILDIALGLGIDIDHACGGVVACSTCHVIVKQGLESCNASMEAEDDQLEKAPGLKPQSRLACQCVPNGTQNVTVEIPSWNRNLVREGS